MTDHFWSTPSGEAHDVRCEGGETVQVFPKVVSAIAADAGNFVWADPTSAQGGNVYNNWPDLAAAIAAVRGQKFVTITFATPTITAGAWPDITDVTFIAGETVPVGVVITAADGATLTAVHKLSLDGVALDYAGTTVPFISLSGTQVLELNLDRLDAEIAEGGGQPVVSLAGSSSLVVWSRSGVIAAGTLAITAIGATIDLFLFNGSVVQAGAVSATALGTVNIVLDGASQPGLNGAAVGTIAPSIEVLDPQPTFVFRPGATGTLDGNVFTTWASLMAAVALTAGPIVILVDGSLAPTHATAGTWMMSSIKFYAKNFLVDNLIVDDGSKWTFGANGWLYIDGGLTITNAAGASGPVITSTTQFIGIFVNNDSTLQSSGATAFMQQSAGGGEIALVSFASTVGDGTHPVLTVDAGHQAALNVYDNSFVEHNSIAGLGTAIVSRDAGSVCQTQSVSTLTIVLQDKANGVSYTPGTSAQWNPAPTIVSAALDQLAAPNVVQQQGNTGTGGQAVTVTTGNLTKQKSGSYDCTGSCSGSTAAAATVTAQLIRDVGGTAVVLASQTVTTTAGQLNFFVELDEAATLPDTATHTFSIQLTCSQNITVASNGARVKCREF